MAKSSRDYILPEGARAFLKRSGVKLSGILLVILGLAGFLLLSSYNPSDPSLNSATIVEPLNIGGLVGSYVTDFMWQIFGLSDFFPCLALVVWGFWICRGFCPSFTVFRILSLPFAMLLFSCSMEGFSFSPVWPMAAGWGGAAEGRGPSRRKGAAGSVCRRNFSCSGRYKPRRCVGDS